MTGPARRRKRQPRNGSVPYVRQQSHEPSTRDRLGDSPLADRRTPGLAADDDATVAIDQLFEQFDILVVDVHRPRTFTVDKDRILLLRLCTGSRLPLGTNRT